MTQSTTQLRRACRSQRRILTALAVVCLSFGHVRPSAAEPGFLEQLPPPRACTLDDSDGILCADGVGLLGASDVALSPDGRNAYVPGLFSDSITTFARNPSTGALIQLAAPDGCLAEGGDGVECAPAVGLGGASDAAVSRDGRFVYVASMSSGIARFARDRSTGRLTQLDGAGIVGFSGPTSLVLSPDGSSLYAAALNANAIAIFAVDKTSGELAQLPAPAGCIAENGNGIQCTDVTALQGPRGMAVSRDGKQVYVASSDGDTLAVFARDRTTGGLSQLPAPAGCFAENGDGVTCTDAVGLNGARAVAISKTGRQVYVASQLANTIAIFARNARTGTLSQFPAPGGCVRHNGDGIECTAAVAMMGPTAIALSKDGKHAYVTAVSSDAVVIFARDKTTGALTQPAAPDGCVSATGSGGSCEVGLGLDLVNGIAMPENGKNVYVTSSGGDSIAAFAREK
jgi:6-phosphogluconolactonase (cycloisomerase 2 family)